MSPRQSQGCPGRCLAGVRKAKVLRPGTDVVLISSGLMTMRARQAAKALEAHHVDVAVVHTPTIKPFESETVLREWNTERLALTVENPTIRRPCRRGRPLG